MLTEREIIDRIASASHDTGVQFAVRLVRENREYLPILLKLLRSDDNWYIRLTIAEALGKIGINTDIVLTALEERLVEDDSFFVRYFCFRSLNILAGEQALFRLLWAYLRILPSDCARLLRNLLELLPLSQAIEAIRLIWMVLGNDEQRCEAPIITWQYRTRGGGELHQSLGTFFELTGLAELTSLHRDARVVYEKLNVLRFAALIELATTRDGIPIEQVINEVGDRPEAAEILVSLEAECDRLREEIAIRRARLRELLVIQARSLGEVERAERGALLEEVRLEIQRTIEEVETLNRQLDGQGEGPLSRLQRETERLLPVLRERGVTFRRLVVDGVLGEYDFVEYKVTLYPPMIELAARDLMSVAPSSFHNVAELEILLNTVVTIHETTHAQLHLGKDSDKKQWVRLTQGSVALHEGLAQFYTLALIKKTGDEKLESAFKALSTKQPEEYTLWSLLEPCSLESVRQFFIAQRDGRRLNTIYEVASEVMRALVATHEWLQKRLRAKGWKAFITQLESTQQKLEEAKTPLQLASACDQILELCVAFPVVKQLLDAILLGGMPSEEERRFLQMAAICQRHPAPDFYARTTLRAVSMKAAMTETTLLPEEVSIRQDIRKVVDTIKMRSNDTRPKTKRKSSRKEKKGGQHTE